YFQMDDCKLSPRPSGHIPIVAAGTSDRGMQFVAEECDFNFVGAGGKMNQPEMAGENVARLVKAGERTGRKVGAYTLITIIADRTDELAFEKMKYYDSGVDFEAIEWSRQQSGADTV